MIEFLKWDSDFFDIKIGCIHLNESVCLKTELNRARVEGFKLVYVYGGRNLYVEQNICEAFNGTLVDRKVVFETRITNQVDAISEVVSEYRSSEEDQVLLELALESGRFSRFKLDTNFKCGDFERFYSTWLSESLNGNIADHVFVAKINTLITGMVTLKINENVAKIGLIAVNPNFQGDRKSVV